MSTRPRALSSILAIGTLLLATAGFSSQDILNDPARSDEERARDAGSKPLQVYAFFGVTAGMTVLDFAPGGGYNTYLLSKLVGPQGKVLAGPTRDDSLQTRLAEAGDALANVSVTAGPAEIAAGSLDAIVTVRNVHDFENRGGAAELYAAMLAALKPGGVLGVVDARTPNEGFDDSTHRINQQMVIDHITAAGFELADQSEMLANANDDFGKYEGMGNRVEIDRMVLKFRKPSM